MAYLCRAAHTCSIASHLIYEHTLLHINLVVSERKILSCFSYLKPMADIHPRGVANLDPRDMVGRICKGNYQTLLYTKCKSSRLCGFREEDVYGPSLLSFICSLLLKDLSSIFIC